MVNIWIYSVWMVKTAKVGLLTICHPLSIPLLRKQRCFVSVRLRLIYFGRFKHGRCVVNRNFEVPILISYEDGKVNNASDRRVRRQASHIPTVGRTLPAATNWKLVEGNNLRPHDGVESRSRLRAEQSKAAYRNPEGVQTHCEWFHKHSQSTGHPSPRCSHLHRKSVQRVVQSNSDRWPPSRILL